MCKLRTDFESNYKSSATNFTDLKLNTNTVIQQSIKTFHKFDNNVVEKNVTNESDVLFKTITLSNKYLKEILISVNDKNAEVSIFIDDIEITRVNVLNWNDKFRILDSSIILGSYLSVHKTTSTNFTIKAKFYDKGFIVGTNVKIYLKRTSVGSEDMKVKAISYTYTEIE